MLVLDKESPRNMSELIVGHFLAPRFSSVHCEGLQGLTAF